MIDIKENVSLAPFTSFGCGGPAEKLAVCESYDETREFLAQATQPINVLGFGTNCLISDKGLPGTTLMIRGGSTKIDGETLETDAGAWWDDAVRRCVEAGLWGAELLSGIPSSVGGAVFGNIAAYGQQVSDSLAEIEVYDLKTRRFITIPKDDIEFAYRSSSLQSLPNLVILKARFKLSPDPSSMLTYESALNVASELSLNPELLESRREIILETRARAGSLYDPNDKNHAKTAGSFFKNPVVSIEVAKELARYDETGKTLERILKQNEVHGGSKSRASAAHALLAAGFYRGQSWGDVRLHPEHILKIENTGKASARQIYDTAQMMLETVKAKLGIVLEPEVRFLGDFNG